MYWYHSEWPEMALSVSHTDKIEKHKDNLQKH
jgi:hypothetical protein